MGLSRRAYAAHRGVSHTAVNKAIKTGRITLEPDGTIDPVKADTDWQHQTDPSKQRGSEASGADAPQSHRSSPTAPPVIKPVPSSAITSVAETLREAGEAPESGGEMSFMRARMANEVLKAQTARVRLQKMKGELVDRGKTTAHVFDLARQERDAWLNWPPRVAANMAAELGVEAHELERVLDKYLRQQLSEMAEVKIELR